MAYSKMHDQLNYDNPFPENIEQFSFPSKEELIEYVGTYSSDGGDDITIKVKDYHLTDENGTIKLVKANNKFVLTIDPSNYMEFVRDENNNVNALKIYGTRGNNTFSRMYKKIK